ncbi:MAG: hypothetical protein M0R30_01835 [Methanoregula sp.]|uniref:hypothetical protein n=1 Tax=Methanoregula sp. TaxID=2052170 RepID=UPI0025F5B89B|nr:hypothetical protein [Methanoregula sp.]MCK9630355.1 hypothetical protein [Methanoregula sp.]
MKSWKARDISAALLRKGFEERSTHHRIFYLCIEGKISGVHTFLSHGVKEYNADLLANMRVQLHLSGKELDVLIRCTLSGEDYAKLLIERGVVEK